MATRKVGKPKRRKYDPDLPSMTCPACRGTGARPGALANYAAIRDAEPVFEIRCLTCQGKGHVNIGERPEAKAAGQ